MGNYRAEEDYLLRKRVCVPSRFADYPELRPEALVVTWRIVLWSIVDPHLWNPHQALSRSGVFENVLGSGVIKSAVVYGER